jgi:hypothetical protein
MAEDSILQVELKFLCLLFTCVVPACVDTQVRVTPMQLMFQLTPAQSKSYNQPCVIFSFFDNHDIWHFLSAASMFFSFMVSIVSVAHSSYWATNSFTCCAVGKAV